MPLQSSGQISFGDAREEGNKTSWVSLNYPTVGRQFDIDINWIISVDESNTIGFNPDGSFPITKLYGWDTWNRPTVEWVYVHQFAEDGGIRVVWKASGGDIWRTGWDLRINAGGGYPSVTNSVGYDYQYGSEHNPGSSDPKVQYNYTKRGIVLSDTVSPWYSYGAFGNYAEGDKADIQHDNPNGTLLLDPTDGSVEPSAIFSWTYYDVGGLLTIDGTTPHYISLVPIDARQHDTLGNSRGDNVHSLVRNSNGYNYAPKHDAGMGAGWNYFDGDNGDGGLILFDGVGIPTIQNKTNTAFEIDIANAYTFYLGGNQLYHWVYITDDVNTVGTHPVYPDSDVIPSGHPYDTPTTDDFTTFELDKWVRYQGNPIEITGLTVNTEYHAYVTKYRETDLDRVERNGVLISAPVKTRDYYEFDDNISGEGSSITTTNTPITQPTLSGQTVEFNGGVDFYLEFAYGADEDGWDVEHVINGGATPSGSGTASTVNCFNTADPAKIRGQMDALPNPGDSVWFRVRATSSSLVDSAWSSWEQATEVGSVPSCPV